MTWAEEMEILEDGEDKRGESYSLKKNPPHLSIAFYSSSLARKCFYPFEVTGPCWLFSKSLLARFECDWEEEEEEEGSCFGEETPCNLVDSQCCLDNSDNKLTPPLEPREDSNENGKLEPRDDDEE